MKTLVVSFGDGQYLELARAAVQRFQRLNDVEGLVLDIMQLPSALPHPTWVKAWIWDMVPADVERVVWIDADVIPIKPIMDLIPNFDVPFCGVEDHARSGRQIAEWQDKTVCDLDHYFNAGVFVASRQTETMFKEWQKGAFIEQVPHWDQTPLNKLLARHFSPGTLHTLPPICNWLHSFGPVPDEIRMAHLAGWKNDKLRFGVLRLFAMLAKEPTREGPVERGVACVEHW